MLGHIVLEKLYGKDIFEVFDITRKKDNRLNNFECDVTNLNSLFKIIKDINPDYIINCIGVLIKGSIQDPSNAILINALLPHKLTQFSKVINAKFIHISTDCVFLGSKGYYTEKTKKDAQDLYGASKAMSEVRNKYCTTIRTSFIGPEQQSKKSLMSWFLSQTNEVNGFKNAFFSGITSLELSKIIFKYFLKDKVLYNRILNVGSKRTSKYDLLKILAKVFNRNILIKEFTDFKIDRTLNNQKFTKLTKYKKKSWYIMLKELKKFMIDNRYKY